MKLTLYHINAFTDKLFSGNMAAIIPLQEWLPDEILANIAAENNVPQTAFYIPSETGYHLRWFTPFEEMDLCGHATIGAAMIISKVENNTSEYIAFSTKSGIINVKCTENWYTLDFPIDQFQLAIPPPGLTESLRANEVLETYKGKNDYMVVLGSEAEVVNLEFDLFAFSTVPTRGIIITAPGDEVDFVSRFFAPQLGFGEDHVTGSSFTTLIPYWAEQLNKTQLVAKQLSKRGGDVRCELKSDRALIGGEAIIYMTGEIHLI
jgi:PhzF family phenazine biosynthesis protein